ncbi:diiron oxygenase [Kitasatospora sp. NPDC048365]|uniref:diiron oxygenase n=1 Tax=Kitasatospora sp. NPDC048365 TaxID=3364050 RepID=UPI00371FFCB4
MSTTGTPRPGPLDRWYEAAGVRTGVRRVFHEESEQGLVFFPEELVPYLDHPAVGELAPERRRELTVRHLYQFLLSTTHLEARVVNAGAAEPIANGRVGLDLTPELRLDAFKVYCDEGYHALYSLDLAQQIAGATGIPVPAFDYGGFVEQLAEAGRRQLPGEPVLAALLQAVVFETLITSVLNQLPGDERVVSTVRELMRDHAVDEGRHHRFFAGLFQELWAGLDRPLRIRAANAMPGLIHAALDWDLDPVRGSLRLAGLDRPTAEQVVRDCYAGPAGTVSLNRMARATLKLCASVGAFDLPGVRDTFAAHGLGDGTEDPR